MALEDLIKSRSSNASLESLSGVPTGSAHAVPKVGRQTADEQTPEGGSNEAPREDAGQPAMHQQGDEGRSAASRRQPSVGASLDNPRPVSEPDAKGQDGGRNRPSDECLARPTALPPVVQEEGVAESQIPRGVCEVVTPSGVSIYYQAAPKRLYKVNGKEVPSVTGVLDVLEKGGLSFWGMKVGIEGMCHLYRDIQMSDDYQAWSVALEDVRVDQFVQKLTERKLTVNHVRDQAGYRGQAVHDALEVWATKGIMPQPDVYGPEERGYVSALANFLIDSGAEAVASEVMVGSAKHKYAGRFDLRARIPAALTEVVVKTYPKKQDLRGTLQGGEWLLDLKTSKGVYDTHYLQLEAYETASIECGYDPTVQRGVIHVTEDGRYELAVSKAVFADFKAILSAYKRLQALKAR